MEETERVGECRIGAAAPISLTLALLSFSAMTSVPHEFVTVDMRGLKTALIERSRSQRVTVSSLVRTLVATGLGQDVQVGSLEPSRQPGHAPKSKLSIRVSPAEALRFVNAARAAGLSQAAYLAELIAGAPDGVSNAARLEQLAALAAVNAELSTLSRNVRHLAALLRQGSIRAAQEYRGMLDGIVGDVRRYLSLASTTLADVRSRRLPCTESEPLHSAAREGSHG